MSEFKNLFRKNFSRAIETVIKADDTDHVYQEVDEYVVTREVAKKLADFFESYNDSDNINGVWISGFFGSGKSHLLKILSYVLENKSLNGDHLGELFASKISDDPKLKGDILSSTKKYKSESILFNIDQQAQITNKTEANAILQVFYKVFYDHLGYYGFRPFIANFEMYLEKEGKYELFKEQFEALYGKPWKEGRMDYPSRRVNDAVANSCGLIFNEPATKYENLLKEYRETQVFSIEDFALKVNAYIKSKGSNFRLNFFVDEVGQYIAENTKLMLNLQTIAESLNTKCHGNAWVVVTSQEDLENLVGDDSGIQSDDFSKIQGRFRVRMPLTSANVDEVIEKRLLEKDDTGTEKLIQLYRREGENLKTLLSFSETGMQFKGYRDEADFVNKYPFIPYQFDLFQQCIKALSRHNAFQGKHQSVGERSMLGVFQEVLKNASFNGLDGLVSFDKMFEGIRASLRTEAQNSIIVAENQLSDSPFALKVLKVLFLVKYYDNFKTTSRNISVLLLDSMDANPTQQHEKVEKALNLLEQQTYIQRKGEEYEFLTDTEKDVEEEIKNTKIDEIAVSQLLNELIFDGIIKDTKIKYIQNKQEFDFARKVDGDLFGRDKELKIEIITPNSNNYNNYSQLASSTLADPGLMVVKLPEDKRLIMEVRMALKTDKYIMQNRSLSNDDNIIRILAEKGQQNRERRRLLENNLNGLLARGTFYLAGKEHEVGAGSDGRNKVLEVAQDIIKVAYSKLELLGSANLDESQLRLIMRSGQYGLFDGNEGTLSAPEREIANFIERRKLQHDRTTLTDLRDHFSKRPYGWTQMAVWCIVAQLYKRGKIEAKQDSNSLEENDFLETLNNNRLWGNTLLEPQVEFTPAQVKKLKDIHLDMFDETNTATEAKDIARLFKEKAKSLESEIKGYLNQSTHYPFLSSLENLAMLLRKLGNMDYADLLTKSNDFEDDLLDDKEHYLDPIRHFWNGEQKKIFDRLLQFLQGNQANFDYVDTQERGFLSEVREDKAPYKGDLIKRAKESMDALETRLIGKIKEEKEITIESAKERITQIQLQDGFGELTPAQQEEILTPFRDIVSRAKNQNYIANLKVDRDRLGNLYTDQLNKIGNILAKNQAKANPPEPGTPEPAPVEHFINIKEVEKKVKSTKGQLKSEADVEEYIDSLRKAMMEQIQQNRKITLN